MARKRRDERSNWPTYLYESAGVYYYRHPRFMARKARLGHDRALAFARARLLNRRFAENEATDQARLFEAVQTEGDPVSSTLPRFIEFWIEERNLKPSSATLYRQRTRRLVQRLGEIPTNLVTTQELAEALANVSAFEYGKLRSLLVNFFRWAKSTGLFPSMAPNPASELLTRRTPAKQRARMKLEWLKKIHAAAPDWMQDLIVLCLHTTLRLGDLVRLRFDQIQGEYLYVTVGKSDTAHRASGPARLAIWLPPHVLERVTAAGERAARRGNCPFIIHTLPAHLRKEYTARKEHHCQVLPAYATKAFARIRDASGAIPQDLEGNPPTIHEIRALASHLLAKAGHDRSEVQRLMAHTDEAMTAHYQDGHEQTFDRLKLELPVDL